MSEVLISMQEKYYNMVASGQKTIEFRRRWRLKSSTAYIYRSGGKRQICAYVELGAPIQGSLSEMRDMAERMMPGCGSEIEDYLRTSDGGYAMPITKFVEFPPISLEEMRAIGVRPPQFYTFLNKHPQLRGMIQHKIKNSANSPHPVRCWQSAPKTAEGLPSSPTGIETDPQ